MLLCHTGLALSSSVAGFGVSLSSVSFLLRVVVEKNRLGARNPSVRLVWHESKFCGNKRPK